jgi:hypothetical protein
MVQISVAINAWIENKDANVAVLLLQMPILFLFIFSMVN